MASSCSTRTPTGSTTAPSSPSPAELGALSAAVSAGAAAAMAEIDMKEHEGAHPCIGALDVAPVVWLDEAGIEPARVEARGLAEALAALGLPVFLYGELRLRSRAPRARLLPPRRLDHLARADGFGPRGGSRPVATAPDCRSRPHHRPGADRRLQHDPRHRRRRRGQADRLATSGGGRRAPRGCERSGSRCATGRCRSRPTCMTRSTLHLAEVVERTRSLARPPRLERQRGRDRRPGPGGDPRGLPDDLPIPGFDRERHVIESRIAASG